MTLLEYLPWLLGTMMLELGVVAALAPRAQRRRALQVCCAANLLTHPLATMLQWFGWADLLSLELIVALVEGLAYWRLLAVSALRAGVLTFAANLLSAIAGVLTLALLGR